MTALKTLNLAFAFILELCLLAALGYWGWQTGGTLLVRLALGVGAPLLLAIVWGIFAAPTAQRRLKQPWLTALKLLLFGVGTIALVIVGQAVAAAVFFVLFLVNSFLAWVWHQD